MEEKHFAGATGVEILMDCGRDLSEATGLEFLVKKPDNTEDVWPAEFVIKDGSPNFMRYVTKDKDLAEPGMYRIHPRATIGTWRGPGIMDSLLIHSLYS